MDDTPRLQKELLQAIDQQRSEYQDLGYRDLDRSESSDYDGIDTDHRTQGRSHSQILTLIKNDSHIRRFLEQREELDAVVTTEVEREWTKVDLENHPFKVEEKLYYELNEVDPAEFVTQLRHRNLLEFLSEVYSQSDLNTEFFMNKLQQLYKLRDLETVQKVREELLLRWKSKLEQKIISWELRRLNDWREALIEQLIDTLEQYTAITKGMRLETEDLGRLWNEAEGVWTKNNFAILTEFQVLLEQDEQLNQIIRELGRGQETDDPSHDLVQTTQLSEPPRSGTTGMEEFVGIQQSNDLNYLLSSEIGLLSDPTLEALFYVKLMEKQLVSYDLNGSNILTDKSQMVDRSDHMGQQGPIIVCIDTSGSMQGAPERVAKTLAYGICRRALLSDRICYLIAFSTKVETIQITSIADIQNLVDFLGYSFNGGTSFQGPMAEALQLLQEDHTYGDADILVISDFVLGSLNNYTRSAMAKLRSHKVDLHSLIISSRSDHQLLDNFTHNWRYRLTQDHQKLGQVRRLP